MKNEPVITRTAVAAAVTLLVTLLAVFDVKVSGDVAERVTDAVYAVLPLVVWAWAAVSARKRVTPVVKDTP